MPNKVYDTALLESFNGTWNWPGATFWGQLIVGTGAFDANDDTFGDVISSATLSEYSGSAKTTLFGLTANSSGEIVPSSGGTLNFGPLAANTNQGNADTRALIICRQLGGSPANSDRCVLFIEDGAQGLQGDGAADMDFSWDDTLIVLDDNVLSDMGTWYKRGLQLVLDGTINFQADSIAGNLYVRLVVGTGAFNAAHTTFDQVLATSGVSEYNNTGYATKTVFNLSTTLNQTQHRVFSSPATLPGEINYPGLFNNVAESHGKILAQVLCYSATATPATSDPVIGWIDDNVGVDKDGTKLRLNGGDGKVMQFQYPEVFVSIESA